MNAHTPSASQAEGFDGQIVCRRCGERKAALPHPPLPGKRGPQVMAQTCADCWHEWIEEQTRLINHEHLLPAEPAHRQVLYQRMTAFLNLAD
jgi:Fe-S cluster biosynthesis and repair protein YggX